MAKEFVRKVRNVSDVSKLNLNETLPADMVQDETGDLWYHGKNEHKQLANDNEVVHLTGTETISGNKTFKDDTTFEKDVDFKGNVSFKDDVPWSDLPALPADWSYIFGNNGYEIRDKTLFINSFAISTQKAVPVNTKTTLFKIPNVTLPADFSALCLLQPGSKAVTFGKWELLKDGTLSIFNYTELVAQTGSDNNHFNFNISVPIV